MKVCPKCKVRKNLTDFRFTKTTQRYSSWCVDCSRILSREYSKVDYYKNKEKYKLRQKKYQEKYPEKFVEIRRMNNLRMKYKAIKHYSNSKMRCACCKESNLAFLTLDHVNNDGAKHRKILGKNTKMSHWVIKNNFPEGFQVLCYNCNIGKGLKKLCPHKNPEIYEIL